MKGTTTSENTKKEIVLKPYQFLTVDGLVVTVWAESQTEAVRKMRE